MPQSVPEIVKYQNGIHNNIKPINNKDEFQRSLLLFTILSLLSDRLALRKINFDDLKGSVSASPSLKKIMKQCLNNAFIINETIDKISPKTIKSSLNIKNSHYEKYGNKFILFQLLLSSFYKYLGLSCLTIESFENRKKTLIGFTNYIEYDKEIIKDRIPIDGNDYKKKLLATEYSSNKISKLQTYPDFIIVNEWENKDQIDKELYDIADECDTLNGTANNYVLKLFDNQEYKLITCISTNYTIPPENDNKSKHNVIYFIDDNFNVYTYTNREFEFEKKTPGFIFQGTKIEDVKCDKIYPLKLDDKYKYKGYEYYFDNDKCDIKLSEYKDKKLNFSLFKGNRILIYYRITKTDVAPAKIASTGPPAVVPVVVPVVVPAPVAKEPAKKPDSVSSLSGIVSLDTDFKKYLKEIKFKEYLNYFKTKIHNYYIKSSQNLANKIIDDDNDNIYKENNDILKDKLRGIVKTKDDIRLKLDLNKISTGDKKYIRQKIENDVKKQRKALEMKIHIFLTMSFQIMISKIKSKAEKELNKIYKSEYKKEIQRIKKIDNIQPNSRSRSAASLKSAVSAIASPPKASPKALSATTAPAPPPHPPVVAPFQPKTGKKHNNKKKK